MRKKRVQLSDEDFVAAVLNSKSIEEVSQETNMGIPAINSKIKTFNKILEENGLTERLPSFKISKSKTASAEILNNPVLN